MKQKEFAEFVWADWPRKQPELPAEAVRASPKNMLSKALELARSPAAKELDDFVGSKPPGFKCPRDTWDGLLSL
jgi:hypothetical protein